MGRRQRRREREAAIVLEGPDGEKVSVPVSCHRPVTDCTVTAGVATASGIVAPDKENED